MSNDPIQMAIDALEKYMSLHEDEVEMEQALTALRQHQQDGEWRPIESAPKDGNQFLVCITNQQNLIVRARFCKVHKFFTTDRMSEGITQPTFFSDDDMWQPMPLPPAPKKENDDVPS